MNITGRLTRNAEVRTLSNEKQVVNFSVAVNDSYLTGRVSTRAWVSKDGEPRAGLNFHTSQIKLHGGSRKAETVQATAQSESNNTKQETEDDLPF